MTSPMNKDAKLGSNDTLNLPVTGERYLPQDMSGDIEFEHLHRYALASELAQDKTVLDIASGEGYGSHLLAQVAKSVIGVDISEQAIAHAKQKYSRKNLDYKIGNCAAIPLEDHCIDLVVSFETIEHHDQHEQMLLEIKRVLKPNGILVISSPDKLNYSDVRSFKNEFHVKELYFEELESLLGKYFSNRKYQGQRVCYGSIISPIKESSNQFETFAGNTSAISKTKGVIDPLYFLAYASDAELPCISSSVFDGTRYFLQLYEKTVADLNLANVRLVQTKQQLNSVVNSIYWRLALPLRLLHRYLVKVVGK